MITGVVLAGGASTRMGRDKALLEWEGASFLWHAANRLTAVPRVGEIVIALGAADREVRYRDALGHDLPMSLRLLPDAAGHEGEGPLAGLAVAAREALAPLALVTPVDVPRLPARALARLVDEYPEGAVVTDRGRLQPLVAAYPAPALAEAAERLLDEGIREAARLVDALDLPTVEASALGIGPHDLDNWNTPADLVGAP